LEELDVLLNQGLVYGPMLGIELVEQFHEKPVAATAFKLSPESEIDLGRKALIFPLELLDQILIQRY
jgi:hypothetical protein